MIASLKIQIMSRQVFRRPKNAVSVSTVAQLGLELSDYRRRHPLLGGEHIVDGCIQGLGPQVAAACAVDEL